MYQSIIGGFSADAAVQDQNFVAFSTSAFRPILWYLVFLGMSAVIVVAGIKKRESKNTQKY